METRYPLFLETTDGKLYNIDRIESISERDGKTYALIPNLGEVELHVKFKMLEKLLTVP